MKISNLLLVLIYLIVVTGIAILTKDTGEKMVPYIKTDYTKILSEGLPLDTLNFDSLPFKHLKTDLSTLAIFPQAGSNQLAISKELRPYFKIQVRNDSLIILSDPTKGNLIHDHFYSALYIAPDQLRSISIEEEGIIIVESISNDSQLTMDSLDIYCNESRFEGHVDCKYIFASGSPHRIRLNGQAQYLKIATTEGEVSAFQLAVDTVEANLTGYGDAEVSPTKLLKASLSDKGDLEYLGSPKIIKKESAYGRVLNFNKPKGI